MTYNSHKSVAQIYKNNKWQQKEKKKIIEKYSLGANKTRQGTSWQKRDFSQEIGRAFSNQLFPGWSTKGMLEVGDAFSPRVPKEFTKDRVIGNSHTTLLLSVRNVYDFNGV